MLDVRGRSFFMILIQKMFVVGSKWPVSWTLLFLIIVRPASLKITWYHKSVSCGILKREHFLKVGITCKFVVEAFKVGC